MKERQAQRTRFGILAARHMLERGRLTPGQVDDLEGCKASGWMADDSQEAFDREYARALRATNFLPGDLVRITLQPTDVCAEFSGRQGVVTHGPDDSYEPGWLISSVGGGLRCVASELTMITPREKRCLTPSRKPRS